jgi:hypothetical protein
VTPLRRAQPGLPASFAPVGKARALGAQRGVITVTGIDDGGVAVDVEHPGGHVLEQLSEVAGLPGLADAAGEQAGSLKGNIGRDLRCGPDRRRRGPPNSATG